LIVLTNSFFQLNFAKHIFVLELSPNDKEVERWRMLVEVKIHQTHYYPVKDLIPMIKKWKCGKFVELHLNETRFYRAARSIFLSKDFAREVEHV